MMIINNVTLSIVIVLLSTSKLEVKTAINSDDIERCCDSVTHGIKKSIFKSFRATLKDGTFIKSSPLPEFTTNEYYNKDGFHIKNVVVYNYEVAIRDSTVFVAKYDNKKKISETYTYYNPSEDINLYKAIQWNENGNPTILEGAMGKITYSYLNAMEISKKIQDKSGEETATAEFKYDSNKNKIEELITYRQDKANYDKVLFQDYILDSRKNWIRREVTINDKYLRIDEREIIY